MGILLSLQDTVPEIISEAGDIATTAKLTFFDLAVKGGWIMLVIFLLSLVAGYIFIERLLVIKKAAKPDPHLMSRVKDYIRSGNVDSALALCQNTDSPVARMLEAGISRLGRPLADISTTIENVGQMEISKLEKAFPTLATIAGAEPMLGFFGTVVGMIQSFYAMAMAGNNIEVSVLSSGIYTSLVTTAGGLVIGILCLFAYNSLVVRVGKVVYALEAASTEFMDILNEPIK